jgi:arsenate reductase
MTCSSADRKCPLIKGAERRISIQYEDPKVFDDTPDEINKYDERSLQIASEFFYVFRKVNTKYSF